MDRLGRCAADGCERVFADVSRNGRPDHLAGLRAARDTRYGPVAATPVCHSSSRQGQSLKSGADRR
ncbi:CGNR zinc finger domain-containing protein [Pseudonocardia parietis]|uniref:CGNR zinc finger domain-containing protein n=1 Tax=Pseudonocardia parietis TaxID=570936 RepID=UPI001FDAB7B9|nr:CGNR zinc finger domain-containing protein [Pseudonocardia parietis]